MYPSFLRVDNEDSNQTKMMRTMSESSCDSQSYVNWASTRQNLSSEGCEQQRRRPACASAQSDQRVCFSNLPQAKFQLSS